MVHGQVNEQRTISNYVSVEISLRTKLHLHFNKDDYLKASAHCHDVDDLGKAWENHASA